MDIILTVIKFIGIISFSVAGAIVAIDKEVDFFGVIFLSIITCFGGGLLRDVIVSEGLPAFFSMHLETLVCILTATAVFFLAMIFKKRYVAEEEFVCRINNVFDALGIGVFSAAGTGMYLHLGPFVAIIMGMLSSVGGSLTRDIILGDIPYILKKRIYMLATLGGSAVYYVIAAHLMAGRESADVVATICCLAVIFTIRMCATAFKWNMPKAIDFTKMRREEEISKEEKSEPKIPETKG